MAVKFYMIQTLVTVGGERCRRVDNVHNIIM
jgi:hypothetical protein